MCEGVIERSSSFSLVFFLISNAINKWIFWYMFKQADTKKHVSEHNCSSVRVFLSILAHLTHFAQSFFLISNAINELIFWYIFKQADTKKHVTDVSEHKCSSVRVFLSILAHLAHLTQFFFLIFKRINKWIFDVSMQIQESMSVSIAGCLVEWF